jgi:hypothetical protein
MMGPLTFLSSADALEMKEKGPRFDGGSEEQTLLCSGGSTLGRRPQLYLFAFLGNHRKRRLIIYFTKCNSQNHDSIFSLHKSCNRQKYLGTNLFHFSLTICVFRIIEIISTCIYFEHNCNLLVNVDYQEIL